MHGRADSGRRTPDLRLVLDFGDRAHSGSGRWADMDDRNEAERDDEKA